MQDENTATRERAQAMNSTQIRQLVDAAASYAEGSMTHDEYQDVERQLVELHEHVYEAAEGRRQYQLNRDHSKRCLAAALIAAVENMRDAAASDADFAYEIHDGQPIFSAARSYLADGTMTCTCEPSSAEDDFARNYVADQLVANWYYEQTQATYR